MLNSILLTTNAFSLATARFVKNPDAGQASVRQGADFDSAEAVSGHADAQSLALWSRYRAPTGLSMLERPVRYVLEYAYTRFYGDLKGVFGYEALHSFGIGLELDTSKHDIIVTRARAVLRFKRGDNVEGYGLGLAVSF